MKIPLVYPKIPDTSNCPLKKCIVFEKLDGTNMHFVFHRQGGDLQCYFQGTRRHRYSFSETEREEFATNHPDLVGAFHLETFIDLEHYINYNENFQHVNELILFTEWFGPNSFAGEHNPTDTMDTYLFDAQVDGRMLPPEEFLYLFQDCPLPKPKVIYRGKYSGQLVEDIRKGKFPVKEGAVIKGFADDQVYMAKVKTNDYMEKLKIRFGDDWKGYWE